MKVSGKMWLDKRCDKDVAKKDRVSHKQNLFKPSCRSQMEAFKIAKHGLSQVYNWQKHPEENWRTVFQGNLPPLLL